MSVTIPLLPVAVVLMAVAVGVWWFLWTRLVDPLLDRIQRALYRRAGISEEDQP